MILLKETIGNLTDPSRFSLTKWRVTGVFRALVEIGLIVAGSVGSVDAEPIYYYTGSTASGAAGDAENWQTADGTPVQNLVIREEGNPVVYRFQSGTYDGSKASSPVWLAGEEKGVHIVSDGPVTLQNWGGGIPPNQGVVTALNGEVVFGDDVSILDNYSSGAATRGGGAVYSGKRIMFGDNARLIHNMTAPPISGAYYGGGAVFLNGAPDGEVVFGKNAIVEKNEAYYGGAIYALGNVHFGEGAVIRENRAPTQGGALRVTGTLTFRAGSLVEANRTDDERSTTYGGAVFLDGTAAISGTAFKNNRTASTGNGGAIYVQNGSVRLSDGTLMEGNQASKGGAVLANKSSVKTSDSAWKANSAAHGGAVTVLSGSLTVQEENGGKSGAGTVFESNTASTAGGAIYAQNSPVVLGSGTRLEGNQASKGGAVYATGDGTTRLVVADTVFKGNTASASGGAVHAQLTDVSLGKGTRLEGNQASMGGAVAAVQSNLTVTDVVFKDNVASQAGGALFLQSGSLLFNVTQTAVMSGNTAGTGGLMYLTKSDATFDVARGMQLQIGDPLYSGSDVHMDSLGVMASASLKKTGAGELKINSPMDDVAGTVSVEEGTLRVARHWAINNTVAVKGGALDMPSFSFSGEDGKLTIEGGTLLTRTGQIFDTALDETGLNSEPGEVRKAVQGRLEFDSGLIGFTDEKYNLAYAGKAAQTLGANYAGSDGQPGDKEITFTGELVSKTEPVPPEEVKPAPEPEPTPGPVGTVGVDDLNENGIHNVVLGNVTVTTASGTGTAEGQNLIVGSTHVDHEQFSQAKALPGSIGGRNLDLGTAGNGVTIVGGHYLTLVGKETDTPLIRSGSDGEKAVDVYVGGKVNGTHTPGTLNLGSVAMSSGGTLKGNVQLAEASSLNVRAGEHRISGETGNGGKNVPGVSNHGGTVTVGEAATLHTSVKQTTGQTRVAGTLFSPSVELEGGRLTVSGAADIGRLAQKGGETAIEGQTRTRSLEATGGSVKVSGTLETERLTGNTSARITVGNDTTAGRLIAASATLGGASLFLDPAWKGNDTIETASHGAVVLDHGKVDGKLAVGRNALLVLGTPSTEETVNLFNTAGLRWGQEGTTAALSLVTPHHLDPGQGALVVDGALTAAPAVKTNSATFGKDSLLIVDAASLNGQAALTSEGGQLDVAEKAGLLLGNVQEGQYLITSGFEDTASVKGWQGEQLTTPDQLIALSLDKSDPGTVKVRADVKDSRTFLPGVAIPDTLNRVWRTGRNDTGSANAGIAFVSKAVDTRYLAQEDTVRTLNGAAQLAVAAGVQATTLQTSETVNRVLWEHLSLTGEADPGENTTLGGKGVSLWANLLYRDSDSSGLRAGRFSADYKNDFGGLLVGADVTREGPDTQRYRVGGAVNVGKGNSHSRGDFSPSRNDYDSYGLSAYGTWRQGDTQLMADLGYQKSDNELKQDVPAALGGKLEADVAGRVWTVGARGEHRYPTDIVDVTPHVGARYLRIKTDAFTTHNREGNVFHTAKDTRNLWQLPIGITLSRNYLAENGWTVKPRLDITFTAVTGDRDATTRVGIPGVGTSDVTSSDVVDSSAWSGMLGWEMAKDRTRVGVQVGYEKSDTIRSRGAMLTVAHRFD